MCGLTPAVCIPSSYTTMVHIQIALHYIPYLIKWMLQLQLFSGLERCGVYSRAATVQGRLPFEDVFVRVIGSIFYMGIVRRTWQAKWTRSVSTALCVGTMSTKQYGLWFWGRFWLPRITRAVTILSRSHHVLERAAVVPWQIHWQYYECY